MIWLCQAPEDIKIITKKGTTDIADKEKEKSAKFFDSEFAKYY